MTKLWDGPVLLGCKNVKCVVSSPVPGGNALGVVTGHQYRVESGGGSISVSVALS